MSERGYMIGTNNLVTEDRDVLSIKKSEELLNVQRGAQVCTNMWAI